MADNFASYRKGLDSPADNGVALSGSDTATFDTTRAVYCGTSGNASVQFEKGSTTVTLNGLVAGTVYPFRINKLMNTGLTAALVGLY